MDGCHNNEAVKSAVFDLLKYLEVPPVAQHSQGLSTTVLHFIVVTSALERP